MARRARKTGKGHFKPFASNSAVKLISIIDDPTLPLLDLVQHPEKQEKLAVLTGPWITSREGQRRDPVVVR